MSQYSPNPCECSGGNVKVKLHLSNYATKAEECNLKLAECVDTSNLVAKTDLASLKADLDKIDIDELKTVLACLGKITNDGENFAKNVYKKLVTKIDVVDNKIPNTN